LELLAEFADDVPMLTFERWKQMGANEVRALAAAALNWHRNRWPGKSPALADDDAKAKS
jgi:hypothetical protein